MLTWFILALEPPFGLYTESMLVERVMIRVSHPVVFNVWSINFEEIIMCAWDPVISKRLSFQESLFVLKQEINDCDEGDIGISRSGATSVTCADGYKTREIGPSDGSDQHSSELSKE
jgi:hypothetical protein